MTTHNPDAIIFDWDGTLVESMKAIHFAHNIVLKHFGLPELTFDEAKKDLRQSAREKYKSLFGERATEAFDLYYKTIHDIHLDWLDTLPEAETFLKFLNDKNIQMGVVSNKRDSILKKEIDHLGWTHFFDSIIGAGRAERDKPAADPILLAFNDIKRSPDSSTLWYVGDTDTDMKAATAAGCVPIFIEHGYGTADEILHLKPFLIVKDLIDLQSKLA